MDQLGISWCFRVADRGRTIGLIMVVSGQVCLTNPWDHMYVAFLNLGLGPWIEMEFALVCLRQSAPMGSHVFFKGSK